MKFKRRFALFVSILFLTFLIFTLSACDNNNQSSSKSQSQNMYGSYLGSCRYKLPEDLSDTVYPKLFEKFEKKLGNFFCSSRLFFHSRQNCRHRK